MEKECERKPELLIMAAGMGSRYGGLKQIDKMDENSHIIIDYSLYDAYRAGFRTVTFLIKREMLEEFRECIGSRVEKYMKVNYVFQELDRLPDGFCIPEGREKPWGTAHAVLCCREAVKGNFAVINADDYYGRHAFEHIYQSLLTLKDGEKHTYCMLGYRLKNTVGESGSYARGVCRVDHATSELIDIVERTSVTRQGECFVYTEMGKNQEEIRQTLDGETIVSMNFWGFTPSVFDDIGSRFAHFLKENLTRNPLKCEYYLPYAVNEAMHDGMATVKVEESEDRWYGVTYRSDKPEVMQAFAQMRARGEYPDRLLD